MSAPESPTPAKAGTPEPIADMRAGDEPPLAILLYRDGTLCAPSDESVTARLEKLAAGFVAVRPGVAFPLPVCVVAQSHLAALWSLYRDVKKADQWVPAKDHAALESRASELQEQAASDKTYWDKTNGHLIDRASELERALNAVLNAGDVIASHFDPGPIPAQDPTQADWDFGNWEYHRNLARSTLNAAKAGGSEA